MSEALTKINNLIIALTSWLTQISSLFFSNTPANVTVKRIKSDGTLEDVVIPNRVAIAAASVEAGGTIAGSASHVGVAVGPDWVEIEPDIEGQLNLTPDVATVVSFIIDLFGVTTLEGMSGNYAHYRTSVSVSYSKPAANVVYNILYGFEEPIISGHLNFGFSMDDSVRTSNYSGNATIPLKLRIFVRNEMNLDPDKTTYIKAVVKKVVLFERAES